MTASAQKRNWKFQLISTLLVLFMTGSILVDSPNYGGAPETARRSPYGGDFLQEWTGAYAVRNSDAEHLFDADYLQSIQHNENLLGFSWPSDRNYAMVYPPFYYAMLSPLALVPYKSAAWILSSLMIACLVISQWLLARTLRQKQAPKPQLPPNTAKRSPAPRLATETVVALIFLAACFFVPVVRSFTLGQKGPFCLLLMVATFVLLKTNRPLLAGLSFGLMAFKPQFAIVILVAMLLKRQWRFLSGVALTFSALAAISWSLGWSSVISYLEFCTGVGDFVESGGYPAHQSHCLYGFLTLINGGTSAMWVKLAWLGGALGIAQILQQTLAGKLDTTAKKFELQFTSLVIATLLISPHLFTYDLAMMLLPFCLTYSYLSAECVAPSTRRRLSVLMLSMFVISGFSYYVAALSGIQVTTLVLLLILAQVAKTVGRPVPKTEPTSPLVASACLST